MKELIEKMSLRARVAFIILCIENALKKDNSLAKWTKILKIFWSQTKMQFVDEWLYEVSKIMPESILEDQYKENNTISFKDYLEINEIYKHTPKHLFDLMELAFECGSVDLYSEIENGSDKTIQSVLKCIEIMKSNQIELPNLELFKNFTITENHGWGRTFTKNDILNENN